MFCSLSNRDATGSEILSYVFTLKSWVRDNDLPVFQADHIGAECQEALKLNMDKYFKQYVENDDLLLALYLNPQHRFKYWASEDQEYDEDSITQITDSDMKNKVYEAVKKYELSLPRNQINEIETPVPANNPTPSSSDEFVGFTGIADTQPTQTMKSFKSYAKLKFKVPTRPQAQPSKDVFTSKAIIDREIEKYLEYPDVEVCIDGSENHNFKPLEWWRSLAVTNELPHLSILARKYLVIQPSSVESERLFSTGAKVYTPQRSRLKPENGERLIVLNHNIQQLDFDY